MNQTKHTAEDCNSKLSKTIFVMGEIGGNDYVSPLLRGIKIDKVEPYIPRVISSISSAITELINIGAKTILVPSFLPVGCLSAILTKYPNLPKEDYDHAGASNGSTYLQNITIKNIKKNFIFFFVITLLPTLSTSITKMHPRTFLATHINMQQARMNSKAGNGIVRRVNLMHKPIRKSADKRQTINELQEELRRTREQLTASESQKMHLQNEHEHAKKQLLIMHEKYMKSEQEKSELAASEEARIQELREVFQDRDRSWKSELEAVQNSCINEIESVKMNYSKLMNKLKAQLEEKSEEIEQLTSELETNMVRNYEEEFINVIVLQYAYELQERIRNEILEKEDRIRYVLHVNKILHLENAEMKEEIVLKENMEVDLKKLRVQSEQWRRASEEAMNVIYAEKNGKTKEKFIDFQYVCNSDEEAKKRKNNTVFTRMGELWKG